MMQVLKYLYRFTRISQCSAIPFRDSSADDDHSPQTCLRNRKPKHGLTKRISHQRISEDIELGLLTGDKAENGNRSRSSSELSYSYQCDTNAAGTSVGDPKAQATSKPVCTTSTAWFGVTLTAHSPEPHSIACTNSTTVCHTAEVH
jgi:hypothetical protein